jgi:hypothetical protein
MKNFKNTYLRFLASFRVGSICKEDKSLPTNEEYADNKFDAEANYRVSNSKFPNRTTAPYNLGNAIYNRTKRSKFVVYIKAIKTLNQDLKTQSLS